MKRVALIACVGTGVLASFGCQPGPDAGAKAPPAAAEQTPAADGPAEVAAAPQAKRYHYRTIVSPHRLRAR